MRNTPANCWKKWDDKASDNTVGHIDKTIRPISNNIETQETISAIKKLVSKMQKVLERYSESSPLQDMISIDNETLLSCLTRMLWKIKAVASLNDVIPQETTYQDKEATSIKDVIVSTPNGYILQVKLPLLYGKQFPGAYLTAALVEDAIKEYQKKDGMIVIPKNEQLVMIFERHIADKKEQVCDNDNYEQRRVTNAIANVLNVSDAYDTMAFYYCAKIVHTLQSSCSIVSVMTQKEFCNHVTDFE